MKKRMLFYLFFMFIFFDVLSVSAETCDKTDIERLKVLAQEVDVSYEYIGAEEFDDDYEYEENSIFNFQVYKVTFQNIGDEVYARYGSINFFENNESLYVDSGTLTFYVYSTNCYETKLRTITLELPKFNEYSLTSYCKEIGSALEECDEWYSDDISYDEFMNAVNEYYDEIEEENKTIFDKVKDFLIDNIIYIGIGILVLVFLVIILVLYKRNKNVLK